MNDPALVNRVGVGRGLLDLVLLPWRLLVAPESFCEGAHPCLGALPLLVVAAAAAVALTRPARPASRTLGLVMLLGTLLWFGFAQTARYLLPTLTAATAFVGEFGAPLVGLLRRPAVLAVAGAVGLVVLLVAGREYPYASRALGALRVDLRLTARTEFLDSRLRHYSMYQWINANVPAGSRVLGVAFLLDPPAFAYSDAEIWLAEWTLQGRAVVSARGDAEVLDRLRAGGFRYVLLDERAREGDWRQGQLDLLRGVAERDLRFLHRVNDLALYEVPSP